jgi:uncharacterized Zn finger protein
MARFGRRRSWGYADYGGGWGWGPRSNGASRRAAGTRAAAALQKRGRKLAPVVLEGRRSAIARTFWGKAWCDNLERYSDYDNRLPRGRTYLRSGSVLDLQIEPGKVSALVQGSSLYDVTVAIDEVPSAHWKRLVAQCAGGIDSVIELLQGNLSTAVMAAMTRPDTGLFPEPARIRISCSCPDWAVMCKHAAAVLYGIGARLDDAPDLLFRLRGADPTDLVASAAKAGIARGTAKVAKEKVLAGADLASVFGIDLDGAGARSPAPAQANGRSKIHADDQAPKRKTPAARRKSVVPKRSPPAETIDKAGLVRRGVTRPTLLRWLAAGVLLATSRPGVYVQTPEAKQRLAKRRLTE